MLLAQQCYPCKLPGKHSQKYLSAAPVSLQLHSPPPSGSGFLRRSPRLRSQIPAPVVKVSRDDEVKGQDISGLTTGESHREREETLRTRKQRKVNRREHRESCAQVVASQKPFPSFFTFGANVFDCERLREKLRAVPCSFLKSYFSLLKLYTSDERQNSSSRSGINEPSRSR